MEKSYQLRQSIVKQKFTPTKSSTTQECITDTQQPAPLFTKTPKNPSTNLLLLLTALISQALTTDCLRIPGCTECIPSNPDRCSKCEAPSYELVTSTNFCKVNCLKLSQAYISSTNSCRDCPDPNCKVCSDNTLECTTCNQGFELPKEGPCRKVCEEGFAWVDGNDCKACSVCRTCADNTLECERGDMDFHIKKLDPEYIVDSFRLELTLFEKSAKSSGAEDGAAGGEAGDGSGLPDGATPDPIILKNKDYLRFRPKVFLKENITNFDMKAHVHRSSLSPNGSVYLYVNINNGLIDFNSYILEVELSDFELYDPASDKFLKLKATKNFTVNNTYSDSDGMTGTAEKIRIWKSTVIAVLEVAQVLALIISPEKAGPFIELIITLRLTDVLKFVNIFHGPLLEDFLRKLSSDRLYGSNKDFQLRTGHYGKFSSRHVDYKMTILDNLKVSLFLVIYGLRIVRIILRGKMEAKAEIKKGFCYFIWYRDALEIGVALLSLFGPFYKALLIIILYCKRIRAFSVVELVLSILCVLMCSHVLFELLWVAHNKEYGARMFNFVVLKSTLVMKNNQVKQLAKLSENEQNERGNGSGGANANSKRGKGGRRGRQRHMSLKAKQRQRKRRNKKRRQKRRENRDEMSDSSESSDSQSADLDDSELDHFDYEEEESDPFDEIYDELDDLYNEEPVINVRKTLSELKYNKPMFLLSISDVMHWRLTPQNTKSYKLGEKSFSWCARMSMPLYITRYFFYIFVIVSSQSMAFLSIFLLFIFESASFIIYYRPVCAHIKYSNIGFLCSKLLQSGGMALYWAFVITISVQNIKNKTNDSLYDSQTVRITSQKIAGRIVLIKLFLSYIINLLSILFSLIFLIYCNLYNTEAFGKVRFSRAFQFTNQKEMKLLRKQQLVVTRKKDGKVKPYRPKINSNFRNGQFMNFDYLNRNRMRQVLEEAEMAEDKEIMNEVLRQGIMNKFKEMKEQKERVKKKKILDLAKREAVMKAKDLDKGIRKEEIDQGKRLL